MSETPNEEACKVLEKVKSLIEWGGSAQGVVSEYDDWAAEYNRDVAAIGYKVPQNVAKQLLESIEKAPTNESKIMDIACGTGLVGATLRGLGFKGILHGIDGSENMIVQARSSGHYDQLSVQLISPDSPIKTPSNVRYDAVTCVGAFTKNHFHAKVLVQLAELLVKGGTLVFSVRESEGSELLCKEIEEEINRLKNSGLLEEICCANTSHNATASVLRVFCMRRL